MNRKKDEHCVRLCRPTFYMTLVRLGHHASSNRISSLAFACLFFNYYYPFYSSVYVSVLALKVYVFRQHCHQFDTVPSNKATVTMVRPAAAALCVISQGPAARGSSFFSPHLAPRRHRKLIEHVRGWTEARRRAIISNLCRCLGGSSRENGQPRRKVITERAGDRSHNTPFRNIRRLIDAKMASALNNGNEDDYSNARHTNFKSAWINKALVHPRF